MSDTPSFPGSIPRVSARVRLMERPDPMRFDVFDLPVDRLGRDGEEAAAAARLLSFWRDRG